MSEFSREEILRLVGEKGVLTVMTF